MVLSVGLNHYRTSTTQIIRRTGSWWNPSIEFYALSVFRVRLLLGKHHERNQARKDRLSQDGRFSSARPPTCAVCSNGRYVRVPLTARTEVDTKNLDLSARNEWRPSSLLPISEVGCQKKYIPFTTHYRNLNLLVDLFFYILLVAFRKK